MSSHAAPLAGLSATHRDLLRILSQTGPSESGPLHHALADYYTDGINHTRVCTTLKGLAEHNYVTKHAHDSQYRLIESDPRALAARQAWQADTNTEGSRE